MVLETLSAAAGVWLWDKYGKDFVDKLGAKAKDRWTQFNWQTAADSYRQKVALLYGTTRILGKPEPVPTMPASA
jgi:hypothetical protein